MSSISDRISTREAVLALLDSCLQFRVQVSLDDAAHVLKVMPIYNYMPKNMAEIVPSLKRLIGPCSFPATNGQANLNTGTFCNLEISLGNEGSFVMYITSRLSYRKGDTANRQKAMLETLGQSFKADEITVEVSAAGTIRARLWWD